MASLPQFSSIPLAAWPIGIGFFVTTPLLFGNIGLSLIGPLPIITEQLGTSGLTKKDKVRVWALFFKAATPYIVSGTILTAALHTFAAFTTSDKLVRNLSIASAISSISIIPWTVAAIMPTNTALLKLDEKTELTTQEEADSTKLIKDWDLKHKVRYVGYGLGWASGLAALLVIVNGL
ncbi:DUF1772-domain-containing protein [Microthyrium microscopicum]|uniref:DUF1772-domain-containing protein n=1 Tax=Microthyrium microscopicum TaxID=703497 RepID=A0A6A6TWC0_9PEZI|nr:DUF1772-domain-containing protein [Microthyrium microscopicum]